LISVIWINILGVCVDWIKCFMRILSVILFLIMIFPSGCGGVKLAPEQQWPQRNVVHWWEEAAAKNKEPAPATSLEVQPQTLAKPEADLVTRDE
jgi:hypothetical protein